MVGPLLTGPSKPLPRKLEEFMQSSGDDGVIVAAFGTILGALDKDILAVMTRAFAQFPQKFIWKLNAGNHYAFPGQSGRKIKRARVNPYQLYQEIRPCSFRGLNVGPLFSFRIFLVRKKFEFKRNPDNIKSFWQS